MKSIEHDALMDRLNKKKQQAAVMIAVLAVAFAAYLVFFRPLLRAYI